MDAILLKIGYGIVLIVTTIIRFPHQIRNKSNNIITNNMKGLEKILLSLIIFGMLVIPLVYIFSGSLSFANYTLPISYHVIGLILMLPTLWLFYRSHNDLGKNWSMSLEIRKGHNIVDSGVYKYIRHPMYSAIWLWCVVQALLLNNYIAGLSGLVSFAFLYFLRVKKEEKMLHKEFGQEYQDYMKRTKRIVPYVL